MALFSGQLSYVRYAAEDAAEDISNEFVLARLQANAFHDLDLLSLKDRSLGWVSAENMALAAFDDLRWAKGPYLVFALRIDERRVPPLAMKAAYLREEIKQLKATGQERLSRRDRDALKEQVRQSLIKKSLPVPSLYELCWTPSQRTVLFFSTSKKANDEFTHFFYRSFDIRLNRPEPASPASAEHRLVSAER